MPIRSNALLIEESIRTPYNTFISREKGLYYNLVIVSD